MSVFRHHHQSFWDHSPQRKLICTRDSRDAKKLLAKHKSLHTIQAARRGDVYKYWLKKLDIKIKTDLRALLIRYRTAVDDLRLAKVGQSIF